jgi:uncharacterized repeat protein (TIGR04076 family)
MSREWNDLIVTVEKVEGFCPVYKPGDRFIISQGYQILSSESCNICLHGLGSLISFSVPLSAGLPLQDLGLGKEADKTAHVRCLDPGPPLTDGGTVTFEIKRIPHKNK